MLTICHKMYNFGTNLQKYLTKEILSILGMVPSEWNPVYISYFKKLRIFFVRQNKPTKENFEKATLFITQTQKCFHYQDDVVFIQDVVRLVFCSRSSNEISSVNPNDDRTTFANDQVSSENVQPKAVLIT